MNPTISQLEMGVLQRAELYGDGLDLTGPHIASPVKAATRECLRKGFLSGKPKSLSLTDSGRSLLAQDRETIHPVG